MPAVSVIIPALNAAKFIGEAIRSALAQSFRDIEVLVVDNGSSDGTGKLAGQSGDPRVQVLRCERRGAAAARNVGLAHAGGQYVQFLDADDLLDPAKIELQLRAMSNSNTHRILASCPWLKFTEDRGDAHPPQERVWPIQSPIEWLACSLSGGGMMQTGCWLTPRELIEAAGPWDESLSLNDDGEYFTRVLLQAKRQVFVPEARVYYRTTPGSLSRKRSRQAIESAFKVCELRAQHILAAADCKRTRTAAATQYLQFAYEFSNDAPDLSTMAMTRIRELGGKPLNTVGGVWFRRLSRLTGYRTSWKFRKTLMGLQAKVP